MVLGLLPYLPALTLWLLVTLVAFQLVVGRDCPDPRQAMLALLLSPAVLTNSSAGRTDTCRGCCSSGLLFAKRYPYWAGIAFGLLTYKLYRTMVVETLTGALIIAGTVALWGSDPWSLYLAQSAPVQRWLIWTWGGPFTLVAPSAFMAGRLWALPCRDCLCDAARRLLDRNCGLGLGISAGGASVVEGSGGDDCGADCDTLLLQL